MTALDVTAAPEVFSDADRERLAQLERTIINGLDAYIAVGRSLEKIRARRLYLLTHRTFREYLADRFGLSHPRGFALCYSAQVADVLEAAGEHPAGAESALREFFPVLRRNGPEATVEAFRKVAPDGGLPLSSPTRASTATGRTHSACSFTRTKRRHRLSRCCGRWSTRRARGERSARRGERRCNTRP